MAPPPQGSRQGGKEKEEDKYKNAKDAKHLLDRIGEKIQDIAHSAALRRSNSELQGILSEATYSRNPSGQETPSKPCELEYEYHTNVTSNVVDPCKKRSGKRLSEVHRGECDNRKIRDSEKKNNVGACAPYRRLHVCDRNLEQIDPAKITTTHNLLVDVCLAAKFEGQSIRGYYPQYDEQYPGSGSDFPMCTMLARSFADIGDIVRGKDLYRRDNKKDKLQEQLKKYFKNIYDNLNGAQKHYGDDENYYKLREDWWALNRQEIWKALTCESGGGRYFRETCAGGTSPTDDKCRCVSGDPPTYFDYVPQYLRWFQEWAEDFCRKRKKKIENAIKNCRGDSGKERYCDLNGFDCTKTARGENKRFSNDECYKCSVACNPFVPWIDNQQKEFDKQKNKYQNEISSNSRRKRSIGSDTYKGYDEQFYNELRSDYGNVETFLEKLSNEGICGSKPQVVTEKADAANFTKGNVDKTFCRTEYCKACPWCGVERNGNKWEDKELGCEKTKTYDRDNITDIPILTPEEGQSGILDKYKKFCDSVKNTANGATPTANGGGQIKKWECHYEKNNEDDGNGDSDNCILGDWQNVKEEDKIMSYYSFFYGSIIDMLNESIEWRTELDKCLKKYSKTCKSRCHDKCKCYKNWITQKKKELDGIKDHFRKQGDIVNPEDRDISCKYILNVSFLEDIEEAYTDKQQLQKIKNRLENKMDKEYKAERTKTAIDDVLQEEEQFAETCKNCQETQPQQPTGDGDVRSGTPTQPRSKEDVDKNVEEEEEEEEEEEDQSDEEDGSKEEVGEQDAVVDEESEETVEVEEEGEGDVEVQGGSDDVVEKTVAKTTTPPDVCKIVGDALTIDNLEKACPTKYVNGREKFPNWKCIPTNTNDVATSDKGAPRRSRRDTEGATASSSDATTGGLCIPPRRRRLYVGKLTQWASPSGDGNTQVTPQAGDEATKRSTSPQAGGGSESPSDGKPASHPNSHPTPSTASQAQSHPLLTAFVESAAIETFFLWHRYKKEWESRHATPEVGAATGVQLLDGGRLSDGDPSNPANLQSGTIPPSFLRQMFYTLGDYRDICVGNTDVVIKGSSGDKEIAQREEKIKGAISSYFSNSVKTPSTSGNDAKTWWNTHGPDIWNGMICALTHKTDNPPEVDDDVKGQLFESGTPKTQYQYQTAKLEEEISGPKTFTPKTAPASSGDNTPLTDFISRPPYFRYLEEWGETFCRQRTRMLKQLEKVCRSGKPGKEHCSGDGHVCTDGERRYNNMFADFLCSGCYEQCRKYRKWIDIKFEEFHNQKNKYEKELQKLSTSSNNGGGDNTCCTEIKEKKTAPEFLKVLYHCKDGEGDKEKGNELDFDKPLETFSRSTYCKTCPLNGVNCTGDNCNEIKVNGITWEKVLDGKTENNQNTTRINVHMIDRRGPFIDKNSEKSFKHSYLFKGLRNQKWECKVINNDTDVCKLDKFDQEVDLNPYTTFKVLLHYWLEDFIEGYYILKKRKVFEQCKENGGNKCSEESKKNCACVKEWVDKKKNEWGKIQEHFKNREQEYGKGNDIKSKVKMFLEKLQHRTELNKIMKPCGGLTAFEESCGLNGDKPSQKKDGKDNDLVLCLIDRLEKKIEQCKKNHAQNGDQPTKTPCHTPSPSGENSTLDVDEEDPENKVGKPAICGNVDTTEPVKEEDEEECNPADNSDEKKDEKKEEPEQTAEVENGAAGPSGPPAPPRPEPPAAPPKPEVEPPLKTALVTSTLAWSVGIGFAAEQPNDVSNDYSSGDIPMNTEPNTLYFDKPDEKPFITSIHDRNLLNGEEYNYDMSTNSMDDIPINRDNNVYSGIDLINDSLNSGNQHIDIYDELLKRKENELFGTNHVKQTTINRFAKPARDDPLHNQLELFHKWLDRHRDMCEKWENDNERLAKLKEEWENETHSGDINSGIPSGNHVLNTDVSIQIHMDNPKTTNEFTYVDSNPNQVDDTYVDSNPDNSSMDTILEDLEKYNEPYYDVQDDIYYDVNDHDTSTVDTNAMDIPSKVQIEMDVNTKLVKEKYPIGDVWDI
ncbi:hypothetical protein C923_02031 [Plasmodium falciparum UGT5.1]|uniref:Duffy-binding-like domain-containing protein n=1 Tax=Plasmodium falciparum UGT5.1 TaxID=1237627 RepID=W7JEE9_PLAFA|nr:hypothetical protein C923_02031 [Plasmodium falciparum UGT5.1]